MAAQQKSNYPTQEELTSETDTIAQVQAKTATLIKYLKTYKVGFSHLPSATVKWNYVLMNMNHWRILPPGAAFEFKAEVAKLVKTTIAADNQPGVESPPEYRMSIFTSIFLKDLSITIDHSKDLSRYQIYLPDPPAKQAYHPQLIRVLAYMIQLYKLNFKVCKTVRGCSIFDINFVRAWCCFLPPEVNATLESYHRNLDKQLAMYPEVMDLADLENYTPPKGTMDIFLLLDFIDPWYHNEERQKWCIKKCTELLAEMYGVEWNVIAAGTSQNTVTWQRSIVLAVLHIMVIASQKTFSSLEAYTAFIVKRVSAFEKVPGFEDLSLVTAKQVLSMIPYKNIEFLRARLVCYPNFRGMLFQAMLMNSSLPFIAQTMKLLRFSSLTTFHFIEEFLIRSPVKYKIHLNPEVLRDVVKWLPAYKDLTDRYDADWCFFKLIEPDNAKYCAANWPTLAYVSVFFAHMTLGETMKNYVYSSRGCKIPIHIIKEGFMSKVKPEYLVQPVVSRSTNMPLMQLDLEESIESEINLE